MDVNKNHISLREGKVFIDGIEILNSVKYELIFTPDVAESKVLGERGKSRRWIGYDITGKITQYKTTPFTREVIQKYLDSGETPEFTSQGIQNDRGSDYYKKYGSDMVTCRGGVFTGDLSLINLDSEGELVQEELTFGAHDIV